jgi:hypothetical protein
MGTSSHVRRWVKMARRGDKVVAIVRPEFRSHFPPSWFMRGGKELSPADVDDPLIRQLLMAAGESMGHTTTGTRHAETRTLLRTQSSSSHESGRLLVVEAPWSDWQQHTEALPPDDRTSTGSTAGKASGPSSAATASPTTASPATPISRAPAPERTWIEIRLVGDNDRPLSGEKLTLTLPTGEAQVGSFDERGTRLVVGLEPGKCRFSLPHLDHAAWSTVSGGGAESLTTVGGSAEEHSIADGESTSSIAVEYGFAPATIWSDPDNSALKKQRPHPNLLMPGDELAIPARKRKEIDLATDKVHTFKRQGARTLVIVQLFDGAEPRKNQEWKLVIGNQTSNGTSDGEGVVELWVTPTDRSGTLTIGKDEYKVQLDFDRLHPVSESSGVQQRLSNLGFWAALPDQPPDECLLAAVRSFQVRVGLDPTGKIDDTTRQKLADLHDRRCAFPAEPATKHKA